MNNQPKKDCFSYNAKCGRCTVLTETVCKNRKCTFYKTQEQYNSDREKYPAKLNT